MQRKATVFNQKKRIAFLWILTVGFFAAAAVIEPVWGGGLHEAIEVTGLVLVFFAILGRLWSILYIGASKNRAVVDIGPYSMTRNPLYLSSLVGIGGVGLMSGSLVLALVMTTAFYMVMRYTARREAADLRRMFGQAYDDYAARTPLFLPNPFLYRGAAKVVFSQRALATTFRDSLFLLALYPVLEALEYLRANGYLPTITKIF